MCIEERGRGIFFNATALLSDSPSSHIYSVPSLRLFLPPLFPIPVLSVWCHFIYFFLPFSCQTYMLLSLRHIILVSQDLTFTSLVSSLLPLRFPAQSLGFWPRLLHHSTVFCIYSLVLLTASGFSSRLRWVFLKSIIARSEVPCLSHLSLSLSPAHSRALSLPLSPLSSSHFALSVG